jgi:signal transduction histidine kinase
MDIPPDTLPLFDELRQRRLVEIQDASAQELIPADLLERWEMASLLCVPIYRNDRLIGVIAAGYSTRRGPFSRKQKRLLEGIGHAVAVGIDNERLIRDLRAANRLKSDFVATMSHELRTPLNVIGGYTELLAEGEFGALQPDAMDVLARVKEACQELSDLVSDFLRYARVEAGVEVVGYAPVEVERLAAEMERLARVLLREESAVTVRVELDDAPSRVVSDPVKLRTVLRNLVNNAAKFTASGAIVVRFSGAAEDGLVVTVRDTGPGIAPENLEIIFEPFRQIDGSATRKHGGIGLGLALSRKLARLLGGDITVESELGFGSTFTLTLPGSAARLRSVRVGGVSRVA